MGDMIHFYSCKSLTYSVNKYLLSTYYVWVPVPGLKNSIMGASACFKAHISKPWFPPLYSQPEQATRRKSVGEGASLSLEVQRLLKVLETHGRIKQEWTPRGKWRKTKRRPRTQSRPRFWNTQKLFRFWREGAKSRITKWVCSLVNCIARHLGVHSVTPLGFYKRHIKKSYKIEFSKHQWEHGHCLKYPSPICYAVIFVLAHTGVVFIVWVSHPSLAFQEESHPPLPTHQ